MDALISAPKAEAGSGALHAAVVKLSGGRAEPLSNLSESSGQQSVTPRDLFERVEGDFRVGFAHLAALGENAR